MMQKTRITVARGDGIGPEIMDATLRILEAAGAAIEPEFIEVGEKVYLDGHLSGISPDAWNTILRNPVFLKAPITTPQGGGFKSLNVSIRKALGLFSNVRPTQSLYPYIETFHPNIDVIIIRENEEDLYAGIEHHQTTDVVQTLKLVSVPGCEKIVRYAFEYARAYGREKVTCMTKDNIMKQTDGLFHKTFDRIAKEYPNIKTEHQIIDIGTALLATRPDQYDVIVTMNLYGDIISDVVAQVAGSVGMAGSANVGESYAMFEAIHGSAPDIAGKGIANPSGLINGAIMMLVHIGQPETAQRLQNALYKTIEDGIHTGDIASEGHTTRRVGTKEFADAVIERLGQEPNKLKGTHFDINPGKPITIPPYVRQKRTRDLVGVDMFVCNEAMSPEQLGNALEKAAGDELMLRIITNRGMVVYPSYFHETFLTDHWRCRFVKRQPGVDPKDTSFVPIHQSDIVALMTRLEKAGIEVVKTENLFYIDGERAFSLGQGE
jgi:isocitrate dehydrogenase